jgi:hypothetical protein
MSHVSVITDHPQALNTWHLNLKPKKLLQKITVLSHTHKTRLYFIPLFRNSNTSVTSPKEETVGIRQHQGQLQTTRSVLVVRLCLRVTQSKKNIGKRSPDDRRSCPWRPISSHTPLWASAVACYRNMQRRTVVNTITPVKWRVQQGKQCIWNAFVCSSGKFTLRFVTAAGRA